MEVSGVKPFHHILNCLSNNQITFRDDNIFENQRNFLKLLIFLQNEIFHRMNNFTERMLCKKMNETFEKKAKSTIFIQSKKRTKWIVYKRLTNEMKKKRNSPL